MSIFIKGIDIPKCCDECVLKYDIKCKCYIGYHHQDTSRASKCPIVEVQTPHGNLIDAKEYENDIRKHYFDNSTVIRCTEIALNNAAPVIEAESEK